MRSVALASVALALVSCSSGSSGGIEVVDVSGPLDASALQFIVDSVDDAASRGQELVVLQINSKAVLDADGYEAVSAMIVDPPMPLAVWVGPAPAAAYGGAGLFAWQAEVSAIAPGSLIAPFEPVVLTTESPDMATPVRAEESGLDLQPAIRQYVQHLDGRTFQTSQGPITVSTLEAIEGGVTNRPVTFREPGLATRFFRLAVTPEAAFFFLVIGLTVIAFEFYALGPAVAAGVGGISLLLAGWGLLTLPVRWWALALAVVGWVVMTVAFQRGGFVLFSLLGAGLLQVAGVNLVHGAGQIDAQWFLVLPSVVAVLFFYLIAMPTVQKARLSTPTIGREALVGEVGTALTAFDPDGLVEVRGGRWRATAHREAGLSPDSEIVVTGVDGMFLEVDRTRAAREN